MTGEPDNVLRLFAFQREHPDWTITPPIDPTRRTAVRAPIEPFRSSRLPQWRATSPDGSIDLWQYELRDLLDVLERVADGR